MMKRGLWYSLLLLPWIGLGALALWVWSVWNQLPPRMAVHFNAAGQPNGWQTPVQLATTAVPFLVVLLAIMTCAAAWCGNREDEYRLLPVAFADVFCLGLLSVFGAIVYSSLNAGCGIMDHMAGIVPFMIASVIGMILFSRRVSARQPPQREPHWTPPGGPVSKNPGQLIAEEVHAGKAWAWLLVAVAPAAAGAGFGISLAAHSVIPWLLLSLSTLMAVLAVLLAWDGFHYRFTSTGLEVRSLGIRFCWIPLPEIKEYRAEECRPLTDFGGWGWRASRGQRAFIWSGHSGVRVRAWNGDVFLGHQDPNRLVRDLDEMMKHTHA
jgi:hypothetical protein